MAKRCTYAHRCGQGPQAQPGGTFVVTAGSNASSSMQAAALAG
jgi:hypothetical protein